MTFLLDENFPRASKAMLEETGCAVYDVRDLFEPGADDNTVFRKAQELDAVLLTTDRDFFHTVPYLWPEHSGVVVIALRKPNRDAILARLSWFLKTLAKENIRNEVYQLRDLSYVRAGL
jgi:predicted nuclease of predicted toxin-antitoxin system